MALRVLDRVRDDRLHAHVMSMRQAALEQRSIISTLSGPKFQAALAGVIALQVAGLWTAKYTTLIGESTFATLLPLLCALLIITFLLPRLVTFKMATVVEAQLAAPPATMSVDAIVAPLSDFEMQPSLDPVIGVLAYDT